MSTVPYSPLSVATQFSTGYGCYLPEYDLVLTSERVVGDSASVVVSDGHYRDQLARVVYLDTRSDIALLKIDTPPDERDAGSASLAEFLQEYGVGNDCSVEQLLEAIDHYRKGDGLAGARCFDCAEVIFEVKVNPRGHCPHCGSEIILPSLVVDPVPTGIDATIEQILAAAGYDPRLARRGPCLWRIRQGSATVEVTYHQESGLVTGDAYLCRLPEAPPAELFGFLLKENFRLRQLALSTRGDDVILSLLIYDRYLTLETALPQFEHLFERADAYDDVLVERFGAVWNAS